MSIRQNLNFHVRHPERSEAKDFLSTWWMRPSAVEGPGRFDSGINATDSSLSLRSHYRRLSMRTSSGTHHLAPGPRRSFDFGSATRQGKTDLPLAFAQDDGALVFGDFAKLPGSVAMPRPDVAATRLEPRRTECDGYLTAPTPGVRRITEHHP